MNKFLTKSSSIDEDAVKKIVNIAIDLSCVTYDSNKNVNIENSEDEVIYSLPKTTGPPGWVIAVGTNKDLIFTNNPLPTGPYLTNPLTNDLVLNNHNIVGDGNIWAGQMRPNTLEVATTSILPVINAGAGGKNRFNDIIDVDNIVSRRNLINVGSSLTMVPGTIISSETIYCTGILQTGTIRSSLGSTILCNSHINMGGSDLTAQTLISNSWNQSSGDTLTVGAKLSSAYEIAGASISTNTIKNQTGTNTLSITSPNVTMNTMSCVSCSVAGTLTSNQVNTNYLGGRSQSYISVTGDLYLNEKALFCKNIANVNKIEFTPQTLQPITTLTNLMNIQSDTSIDLSPDVQVNINSDLDMKNHSIKNAEFQNCEAIDSLFAAVADIPELSNTVTSLNTRVGHVETISNNNSHRINIVEANLTTVSQQTTSNITAINDTINNLTALSSVVDGNIVNISGLETATQTNTSAITNLDTRVDLIESNVIAINNTITQKSIATKTFYDLAVGETRSISDIDSSYVSQTNKNIDIIAGVCYNVDFSCYVDVQGGTSITLESRLHFGTNMYLLSSNLGTMTAGNSYFVNFCYSFVIQSYNPTTKTVGMIWKSNSTFSSASDVNNSRTVARSGSVSGQINAILDNKTVVDIAMCVFSSIGTNTVWVRRNYGIVSKII